MLAGAGNSVEIEKNMHNDKVKTITAYYGDLVWSVSSEKSKRKISNGKLKICSPMVLSP